MLRRLTSVAALAATIGTALVLTAPAAYAGPSESEFVSLTNHARASAGLRGYTVASDLLALARKHSAEMAAKGTIYHNPNLGSDVSNWRAVGENVGMGGSASSIHNAFMNSQHHRDNILDRDFTQVGIGTAVSKDGVLFVTEVFRQPMSSTSTATAPKPAPRRTATTTAPRTTVRAASTPARPVPAKAPSAAALLQARLAAAASFAGQARAAGALDRAITYVGVMGQLG